MEGAKIRRHGSRILAAAAAAGVLVVLVHYWSSVRKVHLTVVVQMPASVRSLDLELRHEEGTVEQVHFSGEPGRHEHRFRVRSGRYVLETRVEHRDGTVDHSIRKIRLESDAKLVLSLR